MSKAKNNQTRLLIEKRKKLAAEIKRDNKTKQETAQQILSWKNDPLEKVISRIKKYSYNHNDAYEANETIIRNLIKKCPRFEHHETYVASLFSLFRYLDPVGNIPEDWRPNTKSLDKQYRSFVTFVFSKFPMPDFIWEPFEIVVDRAYYYQSSPNFNTFNDFCKAIIAGQSPYKLFGPNGKIKIPMTRKMCHLLMLSKQPNPLLAIREAQFRSFDGGVALCNAFCNTRHSGYFQSFAREEFVHSFIEWLSNNPMMDAARVGDITDYVFYRYAQDQKFSMKGRSVNALIDASNEWHKEIAKAKGRSNLAFKPSGFNAFSCVKDNNQFPELWEINEILSSKDLAEEGRKMRHCVYSYADSITKGHVSVWSMKLNGERKVTIEVNNATRKIVQARGSCNRHTSHNEDRILADWANKNHLAISLTKWY